MFKYCTKMKKIFEFIFIICLFFKTEIISSQTIEKPENTAIEFDDAEMHEKMLGVDGDYFYSIRLSTSGKGITYYLEKFSKSKLNKISEFPIGKYNHKKSMAGDYPIADAKILIEIAIKNGVINIFSHVNKNYNERQYLLDSYNLADGKQINTEKILFTIKINKENYGRMKALYSISPDSSKFALLNYLDFETEENHSDGYHLCLYDLSSNKIITTKKLSNFYQNNLVALNSLCIDNNANLYYTFFSNKKSYLTKYDAISEKYNVISLKTSGGIMNFDKNSSTLYIYRNTWQYNKAENSYYNLGIYLAKIDLKSFSLINEKINLFSSDVISKLSCNNGGLASGNCYFYEAENDEYFIIWEEVTDTHVGNIVISRLNSKFDLLWSKAIARSIYLRPELGLENNLASLFIYENNKLNLLFLEHPKIELKKLDFNNTTNCDIPLLRTLPNTNVVEFSISANGSISKKVLFFNEKDLLIPDNKPIKKDFGKYILRFKKGKKESFGVLQLN